MNPAPLTRRELRERERALTATTAAAPFTGPGIGLADNNLRSSFDTISIAFPKPMTLAIDQASESPTAAIATDAVTPAAPVVATVPTAPIDAAPTAASLPAFPSRRALRLAAEKAAAETVTAETVTVETVVVSSETVAADALLAGPANGQSEFAQKKTAPVNLPQPVVTATAGASNQGSDEDAPVSRREARIARTETAGRRAVNIRPATARTAQPSTAQPSAAQRSATQRSATQRSTTRRSTTGVAPRPPAGPQRRPTKSRARNILAKGFPLVAMTFVAGLMIATTTPAAALLSQADVSARSSIQIAVPAGAPAAKEGAQSYTAASGDTLTVARDGYETSSVEKIAQESGIRMEATYTNNPNGTIQWPFPVGVHIGDQFGPRDCAGCSSNHRGQDFNPGDGAPIQTIADGVVRIAENGGGSLGVYMLIDHEIDGRLISSVYAHMQYDTMKYEVGDTVKVGDVIGITGTTGMSTGPHLHFEIRLDGVTNVDPLQWLYNNTN